MTEATDPAWDGWAPHPFVEGEFGDACRTCGVNYPLHGKLDGVRTVDSSDMTMLAWVGPDEFDSTRGIKSAATRVGWIPLAFKGEHEDRARDNALRAQLQNLANDYDIRIQLVRFRYAEVVETLEPGN